MRRDELVPCEPYYTDIIIRGQNLWHSINKLEPPKSFVSWWLYQDDIEYSYILRLMDWWRPKKILEIGYGLGGSAICLRLLFPHATIIHIDIIDFINPTLPQDDGIKYGHNVAKWLLEQGRWYFFCSDSNNPVIPLKIGMQFGLVDILIIDGNHTVQYVTNDYNLYSPIVRDGGLIIFHDSRRDTQKDGIFEVRKALDNLGLRGFDVENREIPSPGLFFTVKGIK